MMWFMNEPRNQTEVALRNSKEYRDLRTERRRGALAALLTTRRGRRVHTRITYMLNDPRVMLVFRAARAEQKLCSRACRGQVLPSRFESSQTPDAVGKDC